MTVAMELPSHILKRLRQIALSFPEAAESGDAGAPVFSVGKEPFASVELLGGSPFLAVRVGSEAPGVKKAGARAFVSRHASKEGWVLLRLAGDVPWDEVKDSVLLAYVSVAPRRMLQALDRALSTH